MSTSSEQPVQLLSAINFPGLAFALVILIVTWFVARFFTRTLQEIGNRIPERRLRLNQGITLLRFIIFLVGVTLAISSAVSLSKEVIIAITGTAAVTIGFALKDLAASVLAGIIIIMDRPFQVGDRVTFDGFYGEITAIGSKASATAALLAMTCHTAGRAMNRSDNQTTASISTVRWAGNAQPAIKA